MQKFAGSQFAVLARSTSVAFVTLLSACGSEVPEDLADATNGEAALAVDDKTLWGDPNISVCWDSFTQSSAEDRALVKTRIEQTFEDATRLNFTGWGECGASGAELVIHVSNSNWPRAEIGRRAASRTPNVWFNFFTDGKAKDLDGDKSPDFTNCYVALPHWGDTRTWSTEREYCIDVAAVHEFLHALSMRHEQTRSDTPSTCKEKADSAAVTKHGYWDITSATNYCNPVWVNDGRLSVLDLDGLQAYYGMRGNDFLWTGIGNVRDYAFSAREDRLAFAPKRQTVNGFFTPVPGDFDADGKDDIFWFAPGETADSFWYGTETPTFTKQSHGVSGTYKYAVSGNFDGLRGDDILFHDSSTSPSLIKWSMGARTYADQAVTMDKAFRPLVGDFNGDRKDDIYWYNASSTNDVIWWSEGNRAFSTQIKDAPSHATPIVGDFDGDKDSDIFWYRSGTSQDLIWYADGKMGFTEYRVTMNGYYAPVAGDFDGNGRDDILFNEYTANDVIWLMGEKPATYLATETRFSGSGDAIVGDFNGDKIDDIFWYQGGAEVRFGYERPTARTHTGLSVLMWGTYESAEAFCKSRGYTSVHSMYATCSGVPGRTYADWNVAAKRWDERKPVLGPNTCYSIIEALSCQR